MDVIQDVGAYAGFAAVVGLAVLSALYFSQARDLRRLREWAGRAPERAAEQAAMTPEQAAADAARPAASGAVRPIPAAKPAGGPKPEPGAKPQPGAKPEPASKPAPVGQPGKAPAPVGKPATAAAAAAPATAAGPAAATASGPAPATPAGAPAKGKPGEPEKAADGGPEPAKPDGGPEPAKGPAVPKPAPVTGGPPPATPPPRPTSPPVLPARPAPPVRSPSAASASSQSTAVLPASTARLRDRGRGAREGLSPRYIALIVAGVIVIGGGAVFGISQLGGDDEATTSGDETAAPQEPVNPSLVTVSVLNGTTVPGLAAQIGDEIEAAGFQRGNVANALDQQRTTSTVLFAPGKDREARVVARKLDIATIEPVDPDSAALGGNASVVVIVGADQTS